MKSIDQIQKMDLLDLEAMARDETVKVPRTLSDDVAATVAAAAVISQENGLPAVLRRTAFYVIPAAVACVIIMVLVRPSDNVLKDTFDDPREAYAETERVMNYISQTMNSAMYKLK